jgi:hypothetical protein
MIDSATFGIPIGGDVEYLADGGRERGVDFRYNLHIIRMGK